MSDSGTTYTIDIPVTGEAKVESAAKAVEVLGTHLDAASKAALAAGDAVKVGQASYSAAEAAANRTAKSVERIGLAVDAQKGKLKVAVEAGDDKGIAQAAAKLQALGQRQSEAAAKASAAKAALASEAAALDKLKASATSAESVEAKLSKQMDAAKKAAAEQAKAAGEGGFRIEGLERSLHKLGGPLGDAGAKVARLGSGIVKLMSSMGAAGPIAVFAVLLAAAVAGVVAFEIAIAAAIVKVALWGIKLADANEHALLLAQGMARSVKGGELLFDKLDQLNRTLPLTEEELSSMAKGLADSGLRGKELTAALEKSAIAAAKLKFGPRFAEEMLSLDQQSKVFKANIAGIFGDLKTDAFLGVLQKLVALFDANTASGNFLKVVFESLFQPLLDGVAKAGPKIERFFLQMEIYAARALIAIKPHGSTILLVAEAFGVAALIIGGVFVAAMLLLGAVLLGPVILMTKLAMAVAGAVTWVEKLGASIVGSLKSISLSDIGSSMIDGLVAGITSRGAAVLTALGGVVTNAVNGVKSMFGIHSPSTVLDKEVGQNLGGGVEQGVDRSAAGVQRSMENLISLPTPQEGKPGAPQTSGRSGASISGNTFQFYAVQGAEDAEARFGALMTRLLEGDSLQLGAAPANA